MANVPTSLPILHLELRVGLRKDRVRMSRITRKIYRIARQVTEDEGGGGPPSLPSRP